jgi:glycerophosphoryl diester phosphodiesterase
MARVGTGSCTRGPLRAVVALGVATVAVVAASLVAPRHPAGFRQPSAVPLHDRPLAVAVDDLRGLRTVAHNVNAIGPLQAAVASGAAVVEVDVLAVRGRLYARHDPVPRSVGSSVPSPRLAEIWEALGPTTAIHLDLKSRGRGAAGAVAGFLAAHPGREVAVSSPDGATLLALRDREVDAALLLSVRSPRELDALAARPELVDLIDGVTIREDLIDGATAAWLTADGLRVVAWTVDDPHRARELAALGVGEVTTDSLALIAALAPPADGEGGEEADVDGTGDGATETPLEVTAGVLLPPELTVDVVAPTDPA